MPILFDLKQYIIEITGVETKLTTENLPAGEDGGG